MDYLSKYANKSVSKFQEGGAMPEGGAPAPEAAPQGGGAADVEGMLAQYAQQPSPELAMAICDALVQMMGGQGGAPASAMGYGGRMGTPKAPVFKRGGKI